MNEGQKEITKEEFEAEQLRTNGAYWEERLKLMEEEKIFLPEGESWDEKHLEPVLCVERDCFVSNPFHSLGAPPRMEIFMGVIYSLPLREVRGLVEEGKVIEVKKIISIEYESLKRKIAEINLDIAWLQKNIHLQMAIQCTEGWLLMAKKNKQLHSFRGNAKYLLSLYERGKKEWQEEQNAKDVCQAERERLLREALEQKKAMRLKQWIEE